MDDKAALEDIRNGGHKGYLALCERYERRLRDYAGYLPETVAEKVVKKVLSQLEQSLSRFNQETELSTWLYRMTDYAIDELALENIREGGERVTRFCISIMSSVCDIMLKNIIYLKKSLMRWLNRFFLNFTRAF